MAVIGLALAYGKRAQVLRQRAVIYATQAQDCADSGWGAVRLGGRNDQTRQFAQEQGALYGYFLDRSAECRYAAWRPWVFVKAAKPPSEVPANYLP